MECKLVRSTMGIVLHYLVKLGMSKIYALVTPPLHIYFKESMAQMQWETCTKLARASLFAVTQA